MKYKMATRSEQDLDNPRYPLELRPFMKNPQM